MRPMSADIVLALFISIIMALAAHAQDTRTQSPAVEARGLWVHPSGVIDPDPRKGMKDIHTLVDRMARANLNLMLPWVRTEYVAAFLDPEYPKDNVFAKLSKWDALGELIKAAAERDIETHLWYSFTYYKSRLSYEMRKHPEWAARRLDELVPDEKTGKVHPPWMTDVCNLHPGARQMELDIIKFLLDRYPLVRGIHIEEPGFGYPGNCFCDLCNQTFKLIYGFDQKQKPGGPEATDLKCLATTDFMRRLRGMMLERDPSLILSANGGYRWQSDRRSGRDWGHWSRLGWLDYYAAQIYVTDFDTLLARTLETLSALRPDTQVFVGFNISPRSIRPVCMKPEELAKAVQTVRTAGADGIIFFWAGVFSDEHARGLRQGPFARPARVPRPPRLLATEQWRLATQAIRLAKCVELPRRWKFMLDERDEGAKKGWFNPDFDDAAWKQIEIGRTWESQGYDYDGYAWYRTAFRLSSLRQSACRMYFGAVDGRCWVYLNGKLAGEHVGWDTPFELDVSGTLKAGQNCIAVRVYDGSGNGGIYKDVFLYQMPPNLVRNPGFEDGLHGWVHTPRASVTEQDAPEGKTCLRLEGTGKDDAKAGFNIKLDKPARGIVKLAFKGKRLGHKRTALVGITVCFVFSDGTQKWVMAPWKLDSAHAGRWISKEGFYEPEKPVTSIAVYCINYRNDALAFFDDVNLALFKRNASHN